MSKIRILPEIVSNKIAAGEIAERPSSIIKELVENSIDAKSSKIEIEIKNGGMSMIRISDNGIGMNKDDALLSLERYATSKIKSDNDLFSIKTLGFRGEALPSIASVSKFSIIAREKDQPFGVKIDLIGGKIQKVSDCGAPFGVMITVKNLFFNTPVRKKFIKSANTEISNIADTITSIAIVNYKIRFTLTSNDKIIKNWPASNYPLYRIVTSVGKNLENNLLEIKEIKKDFSLKGWISKPEISRSTSKFLYFFINRRYIKKDKVIRNSLLSAYKRKLLKGKFPVAILFLTLPYDQVDVNVHPKKQEIKFLNQNQIYTHLYNTITKTLSISENLKWYSPTQKKSKEESSNSFFSLYRSKRITPNKRNNYTNHYNNINKKPQPSLWEKKTFSDLKIIGQYKQSFILCESEEEEDLLIIDQHAAHERIIFNQLKTNINNEKPLCQKLLLPELIELNYTESEKLNNLIPHLKCIGLKIEPFGNKSFIVKSVPVFIDTKKISILIKELICNMTRNKTKIINLDVINECLSTMACHSSIKAKQNLSTLEIKTILKKLDFCKNGSHCPHGRPIWIKIKIADLQKKFGRTPQ